jgi:hypothetical protein
MNWLPYYAQENGHVNSNKKISIRLIKKKIEESPKRWHEVLLKALWTHRTSNHGVTKVTPFKLVYGQEVVLPVEINLQTCRVTKLDALPAVEYAELMMNQIDEILGS